MWSIDQLTTELRALVAISSPYFQEQQVMDYCAAWLQGRGLTVRRHRYHEAAITDFHGENLVVEVEGRPGGPTVCLNGHLDTVPLCAGWSRDPYAGVVEGDRFYGLGAADMKGGCLAMMLATAKLAQAGSFRGRLLLTLVSDEEGPYGLGCNALIEDGLLDGVDCSLVAEPTAAFAEHGGAPCISLGARGAYIYQADFFGQSAHASQPEKGLNAAEQASRFALAATAVQPQLQGQLGRGSLCLLKMEADGGACSVPDLARVTIHRHVNELEDEALVLAEAEEFCRQAGLSCRWRIGLRPTPSEGSSCYAPYIVAADNPFAQLLDQAARQVSGQPPHYHPLDSIGDFNYLGTRLKGAPALLLGPDGGNLHAADEYVSLSSLQTTTEIIYAFLRGALA